MLTEPEAYDLNELSAAAGVTPRTIRYYVQQGLLPAPATRGPGTRYDRPYLDRLQLIRRLQRQHLPLAEIRKRLETLDDLGVRDALAEPADPTETSALDYVRQVLTRHRSDAPAESGLAFEAATTGTSPTAAEADSQRRPTSMLGAALTRVMGGHHAIEPAAPTAPAVSLPRSTRSTWERIPLAPDVELHVRRPLSREQNRQVERLLDAARDLFAEEP